MPRFPINSPSMVLENESRIMFLHAIPHDWIANKPERDIGVDFHLEIIEANGEALGLELLVQLKASNHYSDQDIDEWVRIKGFKTRTYNFLKNKLQVVIIIKWIKSENTAYWLLLKDIPSPNQNKKSFTIYIPRQNVLGDIDWHSIKDHVLMIQKRKLQANA